MDMAGDDHTGLALSLGCGPQMQHQRRRQPAEHVEPTLTLSLLSDDPHKPATPKSETKKPGHARLSSPHSSTVSSFSTVIYPATIVKREKEDVVVGEEAEVETRVSSIRTSDHDDDDDEDGNARKKLRLTKEQSALLEERFKVHSTLNPKQKQALAKQLNLRTRQVEVWFQNRRARTKLKQTEVDCEFLKRCCETLTDQNRRLQNEVNELRAMKLTPSLYMQLPAAAAALTTMCPSCERVLTVAGDGGTNKGRTAPFMLPPNPHFFNPFSHSAAC